MRLTGDAEVHALNRVWRGVDRPTDVLAFPLWEGEGAHLAGALLGDIVISVETAARQAARRRAPLIDELTVLAVHGLLHLVGYDHERSRAEARRMRRREREVLAAIDSRLTPLTARA